MINKQTVGIFSGSASKALSEEVAKILGIKLGDIDLGKFSDGEIKVEVLENVRGHEAYIIQSTCAPSNANLMELMLITDALKRSSASKITAIIPYYGYARQDRRVRSARVPISAKVIADMLNSVGVDRVLTVDLHSESIQGFFDMPADNVYATKIMHDDIKARTTKDEQILVVSPDVGGVVRARALAKFLDESDLAIIDKRRASSNESEVMNIIGDVQGKSCIVPVDIIDIYNGIVTKYVHPRSMLSSLIEVNNDRNLLYKISSNSRYYSSLKFQNQDYRDKCLLNELNEFIN